jgi:hypothetical protein
MNDPNPTVPTNPPVIPAAAEPSPAIPRPEYEFDAEQNAILDSLTQGMIWVRLPLLITGFFQIFIAVGLAFRIPQDGAHIIGVLGHTLAAIVCFLLSSWLLRAAAAFNRVTTTTGRDISNLLIGIRNLAAWFDLLAFFVKLYLVLLAILLIVLLIGLLSGAFRGAGG